MRRSARERESTGVVIIKYVLKMQQIILGAEQKFSVEEKFSAWRVFAYF